MAGYCFSFLFMSAQTCYFRGIHVRVRTRTCPFQIHQEFVVQVHCPWTSRSIHPTNQEAWWLQRGKAHGYFAAHYSDFAGRSIAVYELAHIDYFPTAISRKFIFHRFNFSSLITLYCSRIYRQIRIILTSLESLDNADSNDINNKIFMICDFASFRQSGSQL